jgi:prevent-host-death family protein
MKTINIQAAKTHLSRLVEEVVAGEEIVLAKAGKPLVRLVPYAPARAVRVGGQLAGQIWCAADCWAPDEDVFAASIEAPLPAPVPYRYPMAEPFASPGQYVAEPTPPPTA